MSSSIKSKGDEELEMWLNRATDPTNREINWEAVNRFSQQVSKELEGPQIALRLLAHKIQSPQENEALYALAVTESCVRNCGQVFHQELGKFRFLNEVIKVLSPKYMGSTSSEAVKKRCVECLYGWSKGLYTEPKIREAYEMLKKQNIITKDPVYIDQALRSNPYLPLKRDKSNVIFSDEKTAQEISRLLKSKRPEDLMAANRLIKSVVKQDSERMDRMSKRLEELETVRNNAQLLSEMLGHYRAEEASQSDLEIIRELHRTLSDARPRLYRLAGETDTTDEESMKEVLSVNDLAAEILRRCAAVVGEDHLKDAAAASDRSAESSAAPDSAAAPAAAASANAEATASAGACLIGDMAFDPFDPLGYRPPTSTAASGGGGGSNILDLRDLPPAYSATPSSMSAMSSAAVASTAATATVAASASKPAISAPTASSSGDIDLLSDLFSSASVGPPTQQVGIAPMVPVKGRGGGGGGGTVASGSSSPKPSVPNLALNPSKPSAGTQLQTAGAAATSKTDSAVFKGLDQLGKDFLMRQSPKKSAPEASAASLMATATSSNSKVTGAAVAATPAPAPAPPPAPNGKPEEAATNAGVLAGLPPVSVGSLRPHPDYQPQPVIQSEPVPGQGHVTVMLHFAEPTCAPAPGVAALLCVVSSTLAQPCQDVALAVTCRKHPDAVLAQPPSGDSLASSSPMLPAAPVTQCLLVRDPADKSLAFQLAYRLSDGSQRSQKSLPIVLPEDLLPDS